MAFGFVGDVIEGLAQGAGDLLESVGKEFKRFTKTDLGKAALVGAAIYFTGPAGAGWWGEPTTAAAAGAAGESTAMSVLGEEAVASSGAAAGGAAAAAPVAAAAAPVVNPVNVAPIAESAGTSIGASEGAAASGNWFTGQHPLVQYGLIQGGLGAVQGAFTPNALDVEEERARRAREEDERRRALTNVNTSVGPINLGVRPKPQALLAPRMRSV